MVYMKILLCKHQNELLSLFIEHQNEALKQCDISIKYIKNNTNINDIKKQIEGNQSSELRLRINNGIKNKQSKIKKICEKYIKIDAT